MDSEDGLLAPGPACSGMFPPPSWVIYCTQSLLGPKIPSVNQYRRAPAPVCSSQPCLQSQSRRHLHPSACLQEASANVKPNGSQSRLGIAWQLQTRLPLPSHPTLDPSVGPGPAAASFACGIVTAKQTQLRALETETPAGPHPRLDRSRPRVSRLPQPPERACCCLSTPGVGFRSDNS